MIIVPRDSIAALPPTKTSTAICGPDIQRLHVCLMFQRSKPPALSPVATIKEGSTTFDATRNGKITKG